MTKSNDLNWLKNIKILDTQYNKSFNKNSNENFQIFDGYKT